MSDSPTSYGELADLLANDPIYGSGPTAEGDRHEFLPFPSGRPGCFRARHRDGSAPRCLRPEGDPIHGAADPSPDGRR